LSAAANERVLARPAGIDHPALAAGALYPPIARESPRWLCFGEVCPDAMIQTPPVPALPPPWSRPASSPGVELVTTGKVSRRYEKRGAATLRRPSRRSWPPPIDPTNPLWSSEVLVHARRRRWGSARDRACHPGFRNHRGTGVRRRTRGAANFHSDPALVGRVWRSPGLVAQGVQAAGPAYGAFARRVGRRVPRARPRSTCVFVGTVLAGRLRRGRGSTSTVTRRRSKS